MKRNILAGLAMSVVLGLTACGGLTADPLEGAAGGESSEAQSTSFGEEEVLIGGSLFTLQYAWFLGAKEGMEKWAEENPDAKVKFQFEDNKQDIQTNISNLENLASAGAKGVVVFPVDSKAIIPTMRDLHERKGIQFVVGDYPQEPDTEDDIVWNTFVGHDMLALGTAAGETAVAYLKTLGKEDPTVLYISVPTSGQVSSDRFEGFKNAIMKEFPKARIIEEGDNGAADRNSAQTLTENILQRESEIDIISGHNDAEVVGAYNAVVGNGGFKETKFIGIAGDKEVISYIADENEAWLGEVLQDPVVLGYEAMDALWRSMALNEELPPKYELPKPEVITPGNISSYNWQEWTWLG